MDQGRFVCRNQRALVNGTLSTWAEALSEIPQGSVLGPILFVIFIHDPPEIVASTVEIFVDDTKLFRTITSQEDSNKIQTDLYMLVK